MKIYPKWNLSRAFWLGFAFLVLFFRVELHGATLFDVEAVVLTSPSESTSADQEILKWQRKLESAPTISEYWERLAWSYVAKARVTQDVGFYKLAELTADAWEKRAGANPDARLLRGHVFHNLHRFSEAEKIAYELVEERGLPSDYALLSDALMERGQLAAAVAACERLLSLKPGAQAYSRVAHLRWLYGDLPGAIEAMEAAYRATDSRDSETNAWVLTRLSGYALQLGNREKALRLAEAALAVVKDFPLALAAKGKVLAAGNLNGEAAELFRRAAALNPIVENEWWLADTLRASADEKAAEEVEARLIQRGEFSDPRTLAVFLATRGIEPQRAQKLAKEEIQNRADFLTRDAYAFTLLSASQSVQAVEQLKSETGPRPVDARVWLHAGLIAERAGESGKAVADFANASAMAWMLTPSERTLLSQHAPRATASAR